MNESKKKLAPTSAVFRLFWKHVTPYPAFFAWILLGTLILQGATLAAPLYLREFFNVLAGSTASSEIAWQLLAILQLVALMWFLEWIARRIQDVSHMFMQSRIMANLFASTFDYLIKHSYNFFISNFAGSLTHRVTKFVRAFEVLTDSILMQFFPTFLFVLGAVVVLYLRNHWLGIALGLWCIAFIWFQIWVSRKRQPLREERSASDSNLTGTLADAISNQSTIALFSGFAHERTLFAGVVERWKKATLRSWLADAWIWSGIGLFMLAIEVGLLAGTVLLWQKGLATIGDFVLIQAYLMVTFDRLVTINRELRRFFDAFADAAEMAYILELPHDVKNIPLAKNLVVQTPTISFEHVRFYFYAGRPILNDFTLEIRPREKVALVGPSGAGKTTITKLLLRLYDINTGTIRIDGQDISSVTQESLRNAIAFVPQEPILFHRTLMENIRYGRQEATDEEVVEAARLAHCQEFIALLPDKYQTYVGERGVRLSGGERQRIAIARAILKNAPILVLDEATSSLDSESEMLIRDALEVLMRGKTVIVIAHRLSTIMKMDRIVVLELGSIVAEGTHLELLAQNGLYKKLWSIQAGGFLAPHSEDKKPHGGIEVSEADLVEDEK